MGQSLSQMYIHLIFGTKGRKPLIPEKIEPQLHAYIAGILKKFESPAIEINSTKDHIHILFRLSKNHSLSSIVEDVKKVSSKWMKSKGVSNFYWQIGYGAFSVSSAKLDVVRNYIIRQKQHHHIKSYQDEMEDFISQYNLSSYDSKYFWS